MTSSRVLRLAALIPFAILLGNSSAFAQATRTWVSVVGDDANPCSRTAPCKTFAGAISKTAAGGEIDVIDAGGFGVVTITKSITIDGTGALGGILRPGNAVIVNAPANAVVVLRNLSINGAGTGLDGVKLLQAGTLHIEGCAISGVTLKGIDIVPATAAQVTVKDTVVRNAVAGGLFVRPAGGFIANVTVENSRFESSLFGIRVEDGGKATVNRSVGSNNVTNGFLAVSGGGLAEINIESSVAANNGTNGIHTSGAANAIVRLSNTTVTNNGTGLNAAPGGQILSYGSNRQATQ
jgi:hypothetical protein